MAKVFQLCKELFGKFNWGKNYTLLLDIANDMELEMRALQNFSTTRFANSIRQVTINLREDFLAVVKCLLAIEKDLENNPSTQNNEKLADARRLLKAVNNKQFALELSGISDVYNQFGHLVNIVQKVNLLPWERYDQALDQIMVFETMEYTVLSHDRCVSSGDECLWPRFHSDQETLLSQETYMGAKVTENFPGRLRRTRAFETNEVEQGKEEVVRGVTDKMRKLASRLKADLRKELFTKEVSDTIELTRDVSDFTSLAEKIQQHGQVVIGALQSEKFANTIYQLTNSVDHIPKEILKECYQRFLNSFETYVGRKDPKSIDSKTTIQDFLREDLGLYKGNEIILHCLCTVAVKYGV